jgi:hypothetical protein
MSVQITHRLSITASLDADGNQVQFSRPNTALSDVTETFDVVTAGNLELAQPEADTPLPLGDVGTGRLLYIETNNDITVKLDGEAAGHKIRPGTGTTGKLLIRSEFTDAPTITNDETSDVVAISYLIAGDKN